MATIMIVGKVELFSEDVLDSLAVNNTILVMGEKAAYHGRSKRVHAYNGTVSDEKFSQLFDAYTIQTIWYVSGCVDGGDGFPGERQVLERVLMECSRSEVEKIVILSTVESQNYTERYGAGNEIVNRDYPDSRALRIAQIEELGDYFAQEKEIKVITLRLPYVADRLNAHTFLGSIFHNMEKKEPVRLPFFPKDRVDFLHIDDLINLLLQITGETDDETGSYYALSGYIYTYRDLEALLKLAMPEVEIVYEKRSDMIRWPQYSAELRQRYGFVPVTNVMQEILSYYDTYRREVYHREEGRLQRLMQKLGSDLFKYIELLLVFILAEVISRYTSTSVYFRFVDVRLLFIVIMGTVHGVRHGVLAAVLESIVLVGEFFKTGLSGVTLFYNIENWLPFVIYFVAGSIPGYVHDKAAEELSFANKEYELLRKKYLFLSNVYQGAIQNKGEFKRQILGFTDSFGKIFNAVQKLDSELPQSIFFEGLKVLEEIMNNQTVAIYTLDSLQRFGRLVACSGSLRSRLTASIRIEDYQQVIDVVKGGAVWRNTDLEPGLPMYACGVFRDESIALLMVLWEATEDQYGMHYVNIFQILCGLVQTSFLRALEYEELREDQVTFPGTHVVRPERLEQLISVQKEMKEAGVAAYVLIRFEDQDIRRVNEEVSGMIRANDTLGIDGEGNLYLLLTQVNEESSRIVEERLAQKGLSFHLVDSGEL